MLDLRRKPVKTKKIKINKRFCTPSEAAAITGFHVQTIYHAIREGRLPFEFISEDPPRYLIDRTDLRQWREWVESRKSYWRAGK